MFFFSAESFRLTSLFFYLPPVVPLVQSAKKVTMR